MVIIDLSDPSNYALQFSTQLNLEALEGDLDGLPGVYTAWVAANRPDEITRLGEVEEGFLCLPVGELKMKY